MGPLPRHQIASAAHMPDLDVSVWGPHCREALCTYEWVYVCVHM